MRKQNTLRREVRFEGVGLHSGDKVSLTLKPAPANTGIVFIYNDGKVKEFLPLSVDYVTDTKNNITLSNGRALIKTIEHLTSALFAMKIDNCLIEVSGKEIPVMDGSSKVFIDGIIEAGVELQNEYKSEFVVISPIWVRDEDKFIVLLPYNGLKINYTISFPNSPIGTQNYTFDFSTEGYIREISKARTFGFIEDIDSYTKQGLILGANFENVHVFSKKENKCINGSRYDDEPVRHKVLDIIGALALLPFDLKGYIISYKGGHHIDVMFARKVIEFYNSDFKECLPSEKKNAKAFYTGLFDFIENNIQ
ncbi:MAG: UDP-3-O-acyl-N-acetylglucosamine deacetylase [Brevinematales bacterium]|nr:UDP-3-O-acyl-N-acetylglucosamine deacetylase [Brevinematales bacterium]